jgi:hypothetical protein
MREAEVWWREGSFFDDVDLGSGEWRVERWVEWREAALRSWV